MKHFNKFLHKNLSFLNNTYLRYSLLLILVLYAANFIPYLTYSISELFNNIVLKIITIILILFVATKDPLLALMLAICFLLTIQLNAKRTVINHIKQMVPTVEKMEDKTSPLGFNTQVSCLNENAGCSTNLSAPCDAVAVFKDEENAQGLNCDAPNGFLHNMQTVSPF